LQAEPFQLRLIGHLQTNKAVRAVALFDVIETVDSIKLAKALDKAQLRTGRQLTFLVQVNTGEESQKGGVLPEDLPRFLEQVRAQTSLHITGLMCIPPLDDEPGLHFALLAKLAKEQGLSQLSMGMSADFETAIAFGATHIRVGSALFGERDI
jgi:pyridoxal phosphate enzyme (YggS family)